jgi:hypothetical protein
MINNYVKSIRNKNLGTGYLSLEIAIIHPRDFRALFQSRTGGTSISGFIFNNGQVF